MFGRGMAALRDVWRTRERAIVDFLASLCRVLAKDVRLDSSVEFFNERAVIRRSDDRKVL